MFKKLSKKSYSVLLCIVIVFASISIQSQAASTPPTINQDSVVGELSQSDAYSKYKSFFKNVDGSFIIPGLTSNMCPQGLCKAGDYILISAYDPYEIYNSCIHVVEEVTGEYIKTVWLKDNNYHAGGITSDGTDVYVANSSEGTLAKLSLSQIIKANDKEVVTWNSVTVKDEKKEKVKASFCSYDSDRKVVWVGVFNDKGSSRAYGYFINGTNAKLKYNMVIPQFTQGMCFNGKYVYFSRSYGFENSSKIDKYVYRKDDTKGGIVYYTYKCAPKKTISAPPGSENIFIYNGRLYILFESAAKYYYKGALEAGNVPAPYPVDCVCKYLLSSKI